MNLTNLRTSLAALAMTAAVTATTAREVANFPMTVEGTQVKETVSGNTFGIAGNFAPMSVKSPDGTAWRTDGYTSQIDANIGQVVNGNAMTAEITFAVDTHAIILQDNNDANKTENMVAVVDCLNAGAKSGFSFVLGRTGKYGFKTYVGGNLVALYGPGVLPLWQWTRLTGTVDGNTVRLYLNGTLVASQTASGTGVKVGSSRMLIGNDPYNNNAAWGARTANFNGAIDAIKVYDEAITPSFTSSYADLNLPKSRYANDRQRAVYHGQPGQNWTNETHGLYYNAKDGKYHVFFQRTGSAPIMSHAHWGHITSTDLFNWQDDTPAIWPTESYDLRGCWSGCLFTDSEFNNGNPVILYTGVGYGAGESYANMAFCDDPTTLRQWHKIDGNPLTGRYTNTNRDTYFFRANGQAYFIVGEDGCMLKYKYVNGKWEKTSNFYNFQAGETGTTEMPNIQQLPSGKWLMTYTPYTGSVVALYRIGEINGNGEFVNFTPSEKFDLFAVDGFGLMSPSIGKDKDGNLVSLGITADKMPTEFNLAHGYAHLYSLPRKLTIDGQGRLCQSPFDGYKAMRGTVSKTLTNETINGNVNLNPVRGRQAEISATFTVGDAAFGFNFYKDSKGKGAKLSYDPNSHELKIDFSQLAQERGGNGRNSFAERLNIAPAKGETMKLQLFIDHSIVDIFANDRYAASVRMFPTSDEADLIEVFANGPTKVNSLEAYLIGEGDMAANPVEPYVPKPFVAPANSGRIAFIKAASDMSAQEAAALSFYTSTYKDAKVLTTGDAAKIKASDFDAIWLHIDRNGVSADYKSLPAAFTNNDLVEALKNYVADGGNLMLTGHATMMLEAIGRVNHNYAPNEVASGDGGDGTDEWTVNANFAGTDHRNHPIYKDMQVSTNYTYVQGTFGLLWGGGDASIRRIDHNSMWNFGKIEFKSNAGNRVKKYEADTHSSVIGSWGQVTEDDFGGIIEFYPLTETSGTIIANGLAACQWSVNGENVNANNIKLLTANMFSYLAPANGEGPDRPDPVDPVDPDPEQPDDPITPDPSDDNVLASTEKIAMLIAFDSVDQLLASDHREDKAAYRTFIKEFPNAHVLTPANFGNIGLYDCIWIHCDRQNIETNINGLPEAFRNDAFIQSLQSYLAKGGNIYLTKHAVMLAEKLGRGPAPYLVNSTDSKNIGREQWRANITHRDYDHSDHPIFHGIPTVDSDWGDKLITLIGSNSQDLTIEDHNCMWMNADIARFINEHQAKVLATWGHAGDDFAFNGAAIVEFLPRQGAATRAGVPQDQIDARKGTVIANGIAAYQFEPIAGTNEYQANVNKLTANVLRYLSPSATGAVVSIDNTPADRGTIKAAGRTLIYQGYETEGELTIYTADGRILMKSNVYGSGEIDLNTTPGIIIVVSRQGQTVDTYKLAIR